MSSYVCCCRDANNEGPLMQLDPESGLHYTYCPFYAAEELRERLYGPASSLDGIDGDLAYHSATLDHALVPDRQGGWECGTCSSWSFKCSCGQHVLSSERHSHRHDTESVR